MKKVFYATLALGALILASCQKENSVNGPKVESPVFTASLDTDSDTKTALDETGKKSEWNQDHIWILNGDPKNNSWKKEYKTEATSSSTATFTESNNEVSLGKGPVVAICPASAGNKAWWNKNYPEYVNKLKLDPVQTATAGSYDPNAHIAVAYSENTSLAFNNAVSLLKFTVASGNVSEVCIFPNTKTEYVAGNFSIAVTGDYVGTISKKDDDDSEWENYNYVKATGSFEKGKTYYIACLPTTFTEGFTVEVVSNGIKGDNKTTNKNYELKRNTILDLGSVEYKKTLYLKPNSNWTSANAWFAAYFFNDSDEKTWVKMEQIGADGYYKVVAPDGTKYSKVIFCRMNSANKEDLNWGNTWTQTGDITIGNDNCYTITEDKDNWSAGSWSVYSE